MSGTDACSSAELPARVDGGRTGDSNGGLKELNVRATQIGHTQ
ncbi:hypothetical protein [Halorubrum amylolyticum]|nr:hypothetical protein [Halorubrum amylolyticum]